MGVQKFAIGLSLILSFFAAGGAHAEVVAPDDMIKNTANEVLEILKSDADIEHGNINKLGKIVEDKIATKFDFNRMSRIVLGHNWNNATREQQDQFVVEFRSLLIRTYTSALSKYRNQTLAYKPSHEQPGDSEVTIKTQIIQQGGPAITLDYSLEKIEDGWKVYDVTIEGLSLVVTYRGQFAEEVSQNGMDSLIHKLAEKNKRSLAS